MTLEVRRTVGSDEVDQAMLLRERVFVGEQGVSIEAERDGRDPEALHVVAVDDGVVVGTCRLLLDGRVARLSRMAVEPGRRGAGLGRAVLDLAERCAREAGAELICLHAQIAVRTLYEGLGYQPVGQPFEEEGIEHLLMEKPLA